MGCDKIDIAASDAVVARRMYLQRPESAQRCSLWRRMTQAADVTVPTLGQLPTALVLRLPLRGWVNYFQRTGSIQGQRQH